MTKSPYKPGQQVRLTKASGDAAGLYEIVREYPSETAERQYRVRAVRGTQERMVREGEIAPAR